MQGNPERGALWAVPPPSWSWSACSRPGIRRRRRKRFHEVRAKLLQLLVISLNWECLGHPLEPPVRARLGSAINRHQHEILERFESKLSHMLRSGSFVPDDLGRANDKFQGIIKQLKELPQTLGLQDLACMFQHLHQHLTRSSEGPGGEHKSPDSGGSQADRLESQDGYLIPAPSYGLSHISSPDMEVASDDFGSRPVVADRVNTFL